MVDLRVGAAILKDAIDLEKDKQERSDRSKREEKAAAAAVANNVCSHHQFSISSSAKLG